MKPKDIKSVKVFRKGEQIGTLRRTSRGCEFSYDDKASRPLCFAMPILGEPYRSEGDNVIPYFANLLPEGRRLNVVAKREKISPDDMFSLLLISGHELIGDVHIEPTVKPKGLTNLDSQNLDFGDIRDKVQDFAGVQDKLSMHKEYRFVQRATDFGILKFGDNQFPQIVRNECFFMQLAQKAKFRVPEVRVVQDIKGEEGLYVQRFDRVRIPKSRKWEMLHQEDGCQVCMSFPSRKYSIQFHQLAHEMSQFCASALLAKMDLLKLYVFAYLIGNGDLHAKNVSILEDARTGLTGVSPVYDMISTLPYDLDQNMALPFYGKDRSFSLKLFLDYANRMGLPEPRAKLEIEKLTRVVAENMVHVGEIGLADNMQKKMITEISNRLSKFG